ncbi:MAG: flagellar hook-basal body complex protein FliE [Oscillospiraceae bacterium]|jgi:flagellar hook-basal body complex protein FliE|nr:flagellar hook-basal body complex protein FliE [Oscillospiraceae bacterium]
MDGISLSSNIGDLWYNGVVSPSAVRNPVTSVGDFSGDTSGASLFSNIFNETLNTATVTDDFTKVDNIELMAGTNDDFSGLLLDSSKAELAVNLTVQIRNKMLDAYSEVMRMQV